MVARLRADRGDVESAMVLGLLEELTETDPDGTDLGRRLLRAARRSGWESARSGREAVPVADIASLRSARPCPDGQEGTVSPACGEPCTAKSADHVLSPREIEGMRLGALAQRMLLGSVVVASVHRNRGVVTGSLRLARGRAGRGGAKEPGCGGHRREQR
ncbi:hypothetical protein DUI70_3810 [Streptomyces albus]|nr:hypothetical protein DUI70_3810 [Streptomyces albus]